MLLEEGHHQDYVLLQLSPLLVTVKQPPCVLLCVGREAPLAHPVLLGSREQSLGYPVIRERVLVAIVHAQFALDSGVPVVFDGVVSPSRKPLRNQGPLIAHSAILTFILFVGLNDGLILLISPSLLSDVGVQVVVPPLAALLADSSR